MINDELTDTLKGDIVLVRNPEVWHPVRIMSNNLDVFMRKAHARMQHYIFSTWILRTKRMKGKLRNRKSKLRRK